MTDDEAVLMVEAEVQKMQAKRRIKRVIDAARQQLLKNRCRRQGIPVDSAHCVSVMQRADEVLTRQVESKPIRPFAPEAQSSKLLTEAAADETGLVPIVHTRTVDGQDYCWVTYASWDAARAYYANTTGGADG